MIRHGLMVTLLLLGAVSISTLPTVATAEPAENPEEPRWWGANSPAPSVPFPYVYEPVDSWVYQEVQRQVAQGNLTGLYHHSRLLPRALMANRVAAALKDGKSSVGLLRLAREFAWEGRMMDLELPFEDTRPWITLGPKESHVKFNGLVSAGGVFEKNEGPDFTDRSIFGVRGNYWQPSGFSLNGDFYFTDTRDASRFGDVATFGGTEIHFLNPRFSAAWHNKFFEIWAGRENTWWGPGRSGGLLVGGGADPYAQFGYRVHLGTLVTATAVHGWLSQAEKRFLAYHRVEMNLGKGIRLGVAEAVRYDAAAPEPFYMINLIFYSGVERLLTAEGSDGADRDSLFRANYMLSTDLYWNLAKGWTVYGELMIDDIKRDKGLFVFQSETGVPIRLGYQVGAMHVHEGARRLTVQTEYTRINNFTYSVFYNRNFFHRDEPLGYPLGPDIADLSLWADLDWNLNWTVSARTFHRRTGEGNSGGAWCPPAQETDNRFDTDCQVFGPASGSEFAGVVERRVGFELGLAYAPRDNLSFEVRGGAAFLDNADHVEGDNETRPTGFVLAAWRW